MKHKGIVIALEEDDDLRQWTDQLLSSEGYLVLTARDAEEGLERMRGVQSYAGSVVAIVDSVKPGMTGCDLVAEMKQDPRLQAIPIVLLVGRGPAPVGADRVLEKPVRGPDLLAAIKELLRTTTNGQPRSAG